MHARQKYRVLGEERDRMTCLFDFDKELVEKAMRGDSDDVRIAALEELCKTAFNDYSAIDREIARRNPEWPREWLDRARDLFVHDRFLPLFANPPEEEIEDINALCYKLLKDSIKDAYRFFMADMRSAKKEVSGDAIGYGKDGLSSFWEAHESEILASSEQNATSVMRNVEQSDLMRIVNGHLALMSSLKRRVVRMWMDGHTEREIAMKLGLTTGNVGCIISRTISVLRKKICKKI